MAYTFNPLSGNLDFYKKEISDLGTGDITVLSIGPRFPISTSANDLVRFGYGALELSPASSESVAIGTFAGNGLIDGIQDSVLIGQEVCNLNFVPTGTPMAGTVGIGAFALFSCSGNHNTALGTQAGGGVTSSTGSVYLGFQAGADNDSSNRLFIANDRFSTLISGQFDSGKVGINVDANLIKSSAIFQVNGTNGFYYGPRLTTTQRNAVTPEEGAELYNNSTHTKQFWNGSSWVDMSGGTGGGSSALSIATVTANYTITTEDVVLVNASSPVNITLPSSYTKRLTIKQIGSADATVIGGTMDGNNVLRGGTKAAMTLIFDSTQWWDI